MKKAYFIEWDDKTWEEDESALLEYFKGRATPAETLSREKVLEVLHTIPKGVDIQILGISNIADKICDLVVKPKPMWKVDTIHDEPYCEQTPIEPLKFKPLVAVIEQAQDKINEIIERINKEGE